jgi:hypothetical protein
MTTTALTMIAAVVALGAVYVLLPVAAGTYRKMRGPRFVTCPETLQPTRIELDAKRAALMSTFGKDEPRVAKCARWPEHHDCDQGCLKEAEKTATAK